jgi:hypothetical protein
MLNNLECVVLHKKNAGRICWLEMLCVNDGRIVLKNDVETLHVFMHAEYDQEEQAQAARLCAAINESRSRFKPQENHQP